MGSKIIGYRGVCKSCGWVFKESQTQIIAGMPAKCVKCGNDMMTQSIFENNDRGLTYEISIFCKETGATIRDGCVLTPEETNNLARLKLEETLQLRMADSFFRMIGLSKDEKDKKNIFKLLRRE